MSYSPKSLCCLLLMGLFFFTACDSFSAPPPTTETKEEEMTKKSPAPSPEAVKHFFYAWMADCANDFAIDTSGTWYPSHSARYNALVRIQKIAEDNLNGALNDSTIYNALGGKDSVVWGPAVNISTEISDFYDYYTVENMMYCVKTLKTNHYSVGIAGTNMISSTDWFKEDLVVSDTATSIIGGQISKGSNVGLNQLIDLKADNEPLLNFLTTVLRDDPTATVSISGHSLGGALTQVYSGYLKKKIDESLGIDAKISAWVYAGPTAGNETFATNLIQLLGKENYHAYNNSLDVVPHAWQADSLSKICSMYQNQSICRWDIGENKLVNLVTQYTKDVSKHTSYTIPGTPTTFTDTLPELSMMDCADIFSGAVVLWNTEAEGVHTPFYNHCTSILSHCTLAKDETAEEIAVTFMLFMTELGEQHTTAYTEYFFQEKSDAFQKAVAKYSTVALTSTETENNAIEGIYILDQFLGDVADHFDSPNSCECK